MGMHVFHVHHAVFLCFSMWWEEWLVWLMYWLCRTCTHHPWICWFEVHRSLASMHYDCSMGKNAEFQFAFYLQYNDDFFFFLQKFSDTFHVQKYLRFLSKHTCVCISFLLMMGKTNENLPLLDRARKKRKMKCKSSYINDPNCNLQFRIELPLQIERLGDYSFCVYLNKPNASLKRKEAQ